MAKTGAERQKAYRERRRAAVERQQTETQTAHERIRQLEHMVAWLTARLESVEAVEVRLRALEHLESRLTELEGRVSRYVM